MRYYVQKNTTSDELLLLAVELVDMLELDHSATVFIRTEDLPDETISEPKWTRCVKAALVYLGSEVTEYDTTCTVNRFKNGLQLSVTVRV